MKHIFRFGISSTVFVLGIFLCLAPAKAATLTVCASGTAGQNGCQYIGGDGIQQAIDSAPVGTNENPTTINIKSGTYSRNTSEKFENDDPADGVSGGLAMISTRKKHLILKGEGPSTVLTRGSNSQYGGIVAEGGSVVIENLKIINLYRNTTECDQPYCSWGDAIRLHHVSNSKIVNTILESGENGRNGIDARSSKNVLIKDNLIIKNLLRPIQLFQTTATIANNEIVNDFEGSNYQGISIIKDSKAQIFNNKISSNGNGIWFGQKGNEVFIINNIFYQNAAAGINCSSGTEPVSCHIINNIVVNNKSVGIHADSKNNIKTLRNNLSFGNTGGNFNDFYTDAELIAWENRQMDPKFVSATDFHLQTGSPAINAGDANLKDPDGSRSDMGMYGGSNACPGSNCPTAFKPILLNSSFEWKNFNKWHYGSGVDITTSMVHDCLQWGPCSDGRYYLVLTRKLDGDQTKTDFSTEWIETGQDLGGKKIRVSFDAKAHSVDPVHQPPPALEGLYAQREHPVGSGWLQKIPIPKTVLTGEWKEYSFELEIPASESINTTRFRVVLKPELNYSGYQLGYYYDNMRVELIDAAPPPTNTPVQTQESDVNGDGHITLADYDQIVADFANYNLQLLNKVVSFLMQ